MSVPEWYSEAKTWQQGIAALLGFGGLMVAALWNFRLNRRRDAALREEEMKSVAAALYGEIRLLRVRAAEIARAVANVHIAQGVDARHAIKFDKHFVEVHALPEAILYKALAPKFGLLPSDLLISISSFYENIYAIRLWLPQMIEDPTRGYTYGPLAVLSPARNAAIDVVPALRRIENWIGVPAPQTISNVDLGQAESVIAWEEDFRRTIAEQDQSDT